MNYFTSHKPQATSHKPQATSHKLLRYKFKFFEVLPLILVLFLFTTSCEQEVFIDEASIGKQVFRKSPEDKKQKAIDLAKGIKLKIDDYNSKYKIPHRFRRKYGKFDIENIKVILFPKISEYCIVIPLKRGKKLNEKRLFIAYYKNGVKT